MLKSISDKTFEMFAETPEELCNKVISEHGSGNVIEIHYEDAANEPPPIEPPRVA